MDPLLTSIITLFHENIGLSVYCLLLVSCVVLLTKAAFLYIKGKSDGKRKNKFFWQSFYKSQRGVVRQIAKGMSK